MIRLALICLVVVSVASCKNGAGSSATGPSDSGTGLTNPNPNVAKDTPTIVSLSPSSPTAAPGPQMIVMMGTNYFNNSVIIVTSPSGTVTNIQTPDVLAYSGGNRIDLRVTLATAGVYRLQVRNPGTGLTSATTSFTVVQ